MDRQHSDEPGCLGSNVRLARHEQYKCRQRVPWLSCLHPQRIRVVGTVVTRADHTFYATGMRSQLDLDVALVAAHPVD
jgi:hypothetical protein